MEDLLLPENRALLAAFEAVLQFILDLVAYLGSGTSLQRPHKLPPLKLVILS